MNRTVVTDLEKAQSRGLGLSRAEKRSYSIGKLIRAAMDKGGGTLSGLERECHDEVASDYPQKPDGTFVPFDVFDAPRRRDLNATAFAQGGAFVETVVPGEVIPLLRNQSVVQRLGARFVTGLSGNVGFPRQTGAATVNSLGEQVAVAGSTQSLDQVLLAPHRLSASVTYSRQLVLQSSVDVDDFLREDLSAQVSLKADFLSLQGQGGVEPVGILNTTGIGSLQFGGTATWAQVVAFEQSLAGANALGVPGARVGWATTPSVRSRWKTVAKTGIGVTSVVPVFLVDDFVYPDDSLDTRCNGYRYASTNQILNNLVYMGNWADLIVGFFGRGFDVVVDPYTKAASASVVITVNAFFDVALRHAQSFIVSQDAGNQ